MIFLKIYKRIKFNYFNYQYQSLDLVDNQYLMEGFFGQEFSGDIKYYALELQIENSNLEIYISSISHQLDQEIICCGFKPVRFLSSEYFKIFYTSKTIVSNINFYTILKKKKDQYFIQTWHGFPLKKMVFDLEDYKQRSLESKQFFLDMLKWDEIMVSSDKYYQYLNQSFHLSDNHNLKINKRLLPKNKYLLTNQNNLKLINQLKLKYQIDLNKKTLIYCPTWRKERNKQDQGLDLYELANKLSEYNIIVKLHPHESHLYDQYNQIADNIYCYNNQICDIYQLLLICDILITDYSSIAFDFMTLNKKVIFYSSDDQNYQSQIGLKFSLEEYNLISPKNYTVNQLYKQVLDNQIDNYQKICHDTLLQYQ